MDEPILICFKGDIVKVYKGQEARERRLVSHLLLPIISRPKGQHRIIALPPQLKVFILV